MGEEMRGEEVCVEIMYIKSWQLYLFNEVDAWLEVEPKVDEWLVPRPPISLHTQGDLHWGWSGVWGRD